MHGQVKRVKLTVQNAGGVARRAWPITQGVPFAEQQLQRGTPVCVVEADGTPLPTQSSCLATWGPDQQWVKWLLVDFQCDLEAEETKEFFLEYGGGIEVPAPENPVTVERIQEVQERVLGEFQVYQVPMPEGRIRINTGTLRLDLRTGSAEFLAACAIKTNDGWRDLWGGRPGPYLYMENTNGLLFTSHDGAPAPQITVEEEGPLRACVCIKGYHASSDGVYVCPFIVRLHLFAGRSDVRLFHTFIFDQNPERMEFRRVGIFVPLELGDNLRMAFGGSERAHWAQRWKRAEFLQSSDISYSVSRDGEPFGEGSKTRGWTSLCGSEGCAFVAVRDFWQQYPKGYVLTPQGIDVQLWPAAYNEPLRYSTPWKEWPVYFNGTRDEQEVKRLIEASPTAPLNLKSFAAETTEDIAWIEQMVDKYAPERPASHNDTGTQDGTGAGKTHELWLRFAPALSDQEAESLGLCVQEPLIAPADPQYVGQTRAVRDLLLGADPLFADIDALLDQVIERIAIEPMHRSRLWGFWRFGNMCCSHSTGPGLAYELHYETDPVEGMRHVGPYNNEADDPCWSVWVNFLRTGRRDFFLTASAYSRAMGEVGICHAHPMAPELVGLMHYHNAHQWSGAHSPSHTLNTSLFLHYYFTGDRRMREIALEAADRAVRTQEPAGIISCRHGTLHREFTGPLVCVIEAYLDTWARKYGDLARRSLNWFLRSQEELGVFPRSVYTRGEMGDEMVVEPHPLPLNHSGTVYPIFYEALRHFNSQLLQETIIAEADACLARNAGGWPVTVCALAYELTGDPRYAAFCKRQVLRSESHLRSVVNLANNSIFSGIRNGHLEVLKAAVVRAQQQDPEGLAQAEEELPQYLGTDQRKPPSPYYTPPEKSLGVPEGYDL